LETTRSVRMRTLTLIATVLLSILVGQPVNTSLPRIHAPARVAALPTDAYTWDDRAVDALMDRYEAGTGLWRATGWWNSANALTSLIDYMLLTEDRRYLWVVANTFHRARSAHDGDFTNGFADDTGWWALAWIRAYDLTGRRRYLVTAQTDVDHMWSYHDAVCGGGLWWNARRHYKNAITNELFVKAASELHARLADDRRYVRRALNTWKWFAQSGMINSDHLVNDGLDPRTCSNNHDTTWTYNQGVVLGALVDLARATGRAHLWGVARTLADASTGVGPLRVDGVLTEPCEESGCGADGASFKGIYARNLGELARATSDAHDRNSLASDALVAHDRDRTPSDRYGLHWAGPPEPFTSASQQSAVDLMVAALD
jgi:predicted alpha-1,6-mannanase (GH76 family)